MENEQLGFDFLPEIDYVWFCDDELFQRFPQNCKCHLMVVYKEEIESRQWLTQDLGAAFDFLLSALIP